MLLKSKSRPTSPPPHMGDDRTYGEALLFAAKAEIEAKNIPGAV